MIIRMIVIRRGYSAVRVDGCVVSFLHICIGGIGTGDIDGGDIDGGDLESEFTSISVRGMVTIQRQRSETARLAMNTFLAVTIAINSTYR